MTKEKKQNIIRYILFGLALLLAGTLLVLSIGYMRDSPKTENVQRICKAVVSIEGEEKKEVSLPYTIKNLSPNAKVTLETTFRSEENASVFIQTTYAHADVYLDNALAFTFGKEENYPFFMMNPAKEVHVIESYGSGQDMPLRIEYFAPPTGDDLVLDCPMIGNSKELILDRYEHYGFAWMLAITELLGGIALLLISIVLVLVDRKGILFTWLGLFAFTTGLWFMGNNLFSVTVFPTTTWLYTSSYLGFMVCIVPLLRFIRISVDFNNPKPLYYLEGLFSAGTILATTLQLCKVYPLHKSWVYFCLSTPPALIFLTVLLFYERFHFKNKSAERFLVPNLILTFCATGGMINILFGNFSLPISIFQIGVFLFLMIMGILAGMSVKDSIDLKTREAKLQVQKNILNIQIKQQKENSLLLAKNEQEISHQRHDLRHHLAVIQDLSEDNVPLQNYLNNLMQKIPLSREHFCENDVVNAVIAHYASICERDGIRLTCKLIVPITDSRSIDSNLCVIFSNLLENAVEACNRMTEGEKFIQINSTLQNKMLTITMNNSFTGEAKKIGGRYLSSKRDDFGIGLVSIRNIAASAHGDADFHAEGQEFLSSVYLHLSE